MASCSSTVPTTARGSGRCRPAAQPAVPGRGPAGPRRPGGRPATAGILALDDLICSALAGLDRTGWQQAVVVGRSLGGAVAAGLAARAPQRVHHLVLIAASVPGPAAAPWTAGHPGCAGCPAWAWPCGPAAAAPRSPSRPGGPAAWPATSATPRPAGSWAGSSRTPPGSSPRPCPPRRCPPACPAATSSPAGTGSTRPAARPPQPPAWAPPSSRSTAGTIPCSLSPPRWPASSTRPPASLVRHRLRRGPRRRPAARDRPAPGRPRTIVRRTRHDITLLPRTARRSAATTRSGAT